MSGYKVSRTANNRLDEIYDYTAQKWGEAQADIYIGGLFERFGAIVMREFAWRAIPADFGVSGFVCKHEHHFIYWKLLADGSVGIVTILHERMHQIDRLRDDFG